MHFNHLQTRPRYFKCPICYAIKLRLFALRYCPLVDNMCFYLNRQFNFFMLFRNYWKTWRDCRLCKIIDFVFHQYQTYRWKHCNAFYQSNEPCLLLFIFLALQLWEKHKKKLICKQYMKLATIITQHWQPRASQSMVVQKIKFYCHQLAKPRRVFDTHITS